MRRFLNGGFNRIVWAALVPVLALALIGCPGKNSPSSPTSPNNNSSGPDNTPTATNSPTPGSPTVTHTATITLTLTKTNTPSVTATNSNTPTISPTFTNSFTLTVTSSPTNSATPTLTSSPTNSATSTFTFTITRTPTITLTPTITNSPTVTATNTPCGNPVTVGITSMNASEGANNTTGVEYTNVTLPSAGTVDSILVQISESSPSTLEAALYTTDSNGYPASLVSYTGTQAVTLTSGFHWVSLSVPYAHLNGGNYSICFYDASTSTINIGANTGGSYGIATLNGSLANMPSSPVTETGYTPNLLVKYCPDGNPTFTLTPTITNTPTVTSTPTSTGTPAMPCGAGSVSFGQMIYSQSGPSFGDSSEVLYSDFTPTSSGVLSRIWVDLYAASNTVLEVALYTTDGSGNPATLLTYASQTNFNETNVGWTNFPVPPVTITGGTQYALCLMYVSGTVSMTYGQYNGGTNFGIAVASGGSIANKPTSGSFSANALDIFGEYCPTTPLTVTPTPTITATPTVTATVTPTFTVCGSPATFGLTNPTVESLYADNSQIYFSDFTPSSPGTVSRLYFDLVIGVSDPQTIQAALYSVDGSGYPLAPLGVSGFQAITSTGWSGVDIPAVAVTSGTSYAICLSWPSTYGISLPFYQSSSGTNLGSATLNGDLNSTPTSPTFAPGTLGAYAVYCP